MPILSAIWAKNPFNVPGSAIAIINGSNPLGTCALALGKRQVRGTITSDAPAAIEIKGGGGAVNINMPGCGVFSNSTSGATPCDPTDRNASIHLQGSFTFLAGSVGTAGCVGQTGGASQIGEPTTAGATKTFTQNDGSVADPYANETIPTPGSPPAPCVNPTYPPKNANPVTGLTPMPLTPGRYCSLDTSPPGHGGAQYAVTLASGVYVFDSQNNQTTVNVQNGSLTGTGVTLEFTSSASPPQYPPTTKPMLAVDSNGAMSLTAPTSGQTAGFVIMGDRTMPLGTLFDTHSNPNTQLSGTVYLPNGNLDFQGNPVTGSTICLQIIANTITLEGNSSLTNSNCDNLTGGQKPISSVTLVK